VSGVFWPATGVLFAFLLLYPPRYWPALLAFGFLSEILGNEVFAPPGLAYTMSGLLFFVKFAAALLGVGLMHVTVRGPISFARLHQVLGFAGSAAVSTLVCAVIAVSLRNGVNSDRESGWPRCRAGG
jgi:integral membrane sensor domain MASE1